MLVGAAVLVFLLTLVIQWVNRKVPTDGPPLNITARTLAFVVLALNGLSSTSLALRALSVILLTVAGRAIGVVILDWRRWWMRRPFDIPPYLIGPKDKIRIVGDVLFITRPSGTVLTVRRKR